MHPSWDSHQIAHTGDQIYNSQETFQAYEGNSSVKLWGLYNGGENENNLYREFSNSQLPVGTEIQLNAQFFTHADDNMLDWGNNTVLFIKYFDDNWTWYGMDAQIIDASSGFTANTWHQYNVTGVVPDGATKVQVGILYHQLSPDDHGSIYMDDFQMSVNIDFEYGSIGNVVQFKNGESRQALLKNFTITNGYASGNWPENQGGGIMIVNGSSPTLMNLKVVNNFAESNGGGLSAQDDCEPLILSCSFVGNETNNAGGGTYFHNRCHAVLRSVTIEDNISGGDGGALYSRDQSNLTIESSIIKNNNANGVVGGLYIRDANPFIISSTELEYNQGDAIYITGGQDHRISNMSINYNSGNGLLVHYTSNFLVTDSYISNNGRGVNIHGSAPVISNNLIVNNESAVSFSNGAKPIFVNNTISNNNPIDPFHQIEMVNNCFPEFMNSIIWGESGYDVIKDLHFYGEPSKVKLSYSIIDEEGISGFQENNVILLEGMINSDPQFTNPEGLDFSLNQSSPGIDAGNPNTIYNDLDNSQNDLGYQGGRGLMVFARGSDPNIWQSYGNVDNYTSLDPLYMGYAGVNRGNRSYELHIVNTNQNDLTLNNWNSSDDQFSIWTHQSDNSSNFFPFTVQSNSSSWVNNVSQMWFAFQPNTSGNQNGNITISSTLNGESLDLIFNLTGLGYDIPSDVIRVPEDVPEIQFAIDNALNFDTIKVASGVYHENLSFSERELYLVGDLDELPVIAHNPQNHHNSVIHITSSGNSLIKNFIITGGKGHWLGNGRLPHGDNYVGGGIKIDNYDWIDPYSNPHTPRLENLIIEENSAGYGAGIFSRESNPKISNCIIRNNSTGEHGGEYGHSGIEGGGIYFIHSGNGLWTEIKILK